MFIKLFSSRLLIILLSILVTNSAIAAKSKALIFGTPPTQSYELTKKNYQPLADYLSKQIGQQVIVKPAKSFHEYTRKMKNSYYDIILDGPHFIKYRIEKMKHIVLVKQPGKLKFAIVVSSDNDIKNYKELMNKRVCSPATPHLGTLTFLDLYSNPIRQPLLIPVQSFKHAIACVKDNKAVAAVVRDKFWFKKVKNKKDLKVLYITKNDMPARGLSVNKITVNDLTQHKIISALTSKKAKKLIKKALSTVGGTKFVKAKQAEYANLNELLSMVWGFHI
jgi:ABC-type phosphate/phosphonate transport system substrate-binding protein